MLVKNVEGKSRKAGQTRKPKGKSKSTTNTSKQKLLYYGCNNPGHFIAEYPEQQKENDANVAEDYMSMHVCNTVEKSYSINEYK